uniref:Peptidase S9 n=1 Tax=Thermosporothrix sp. COM3 TaxID=2490863 RepID=A0A455SD75_9CHLR|nr:peptidase S9 [Thermosporothrix sp. COM3]
MFEETAQIYGFALSPDGKSVALTTRTGKRSLLSWVEVESGQWIKSMELPVAGQAVSWSPDGTMLVCSGERSSQASTDLLLITENGAEVLLSQPGQHITWPTWNPEGTALACACFHGPPRRDHPQIMTFQLASRQLVQQTTGGGSLPQFTPCGRKLLFYRPPDLWVVDLVTRQEHRLTHHEKTLLYPRCCHGTKLLFEYGSYSIRQIGLLDLNSFHVEPLSAEDEDARGPSWSPEGEITYIENQTSLVGLLPSGERLWSVALPEPDGVEAYPYTAPQWAHQGSRLVLLDTMRSRLWLFEKEPVPTFKQLVCFRSPSVAPLRAQRIQYADATGRVIPALLFGPQGPADDKKAVIWVHGGPHSQTSLSDPSVRALVDAGWLVLAPDYQGSIGHGPIWEQLPPEQRGERDLLDVVSGHPYLVEHLGIPSHRIAIAGYSYGGYLALLALTQYPSLWAAGASLWGIWDAREIQRMAAPMKAVSRFSEAWLDARSPLAQIKQLQAPVLILHGAHDSTSTVQEVQSVKEQLTGLGRVCDVHVFADAGHGLPQYTHVCCERLLCFLRQYC